jgi:hypothetical protein
MVSSRPRIERYVELALDSREEPVPIADALGRRLLFEDFASHRPTDGTDARFQR